MKPTYARPRKCPRTLLRFVLGTLLMKLAPVVPGGRFSRGAAHLYLHFQITVRLGLGRELNRYHHLTMMYSKIGAYGVYIFSYFALKHRL